MVNRDGTFCKLQARDLAGLLDFQTSTSFEGEAGNGQAAHFSGR